jgi:hypothetical protein
MNTINVNVQLDMADALGLDNLRDATDCEVSFLTTM